MEPTKQQEELIMVEIDNWLEKLEALERLEKNKDFQAIIIDGYFKEYAVEKVSLLAVDSIKRAGQRPDVMETLVAISQLQDYFKMIKNIGGAARQDYEDRHAPSVA